MSNQVPVKGKDKSTIVNCNKQSNNVAAIKLYINNMMIRSTMIGSLDFNLDRNFTDMRVIIYKNCSASAATAYLDQKFSSPRSVSF